MHTVGIVAEYNPFHMGHKYHIEKAREETAADGVVVIMSGSFVQRGEPAVFDKWTRAFCAIRGGADLVLELPALYALSSAEGFAKGAVETLRATGVVDILSFGSESGEIEVLRKAASVLEKEPPVFRTALQENLKTGKTYAAARAAALSAANENLSEVLTKPNNILAVNYLRALHGMKAHTVKRVGAGYLDTEIENTFPSAMALREKIYNGESVDAFLPYASSGFQVHTMEMYEEMLLYALRMDEWKTYASIPEMIRRRLAGCNTESLEKVMESVKTKHIAMASIKRALMQILLHNKVPTNTLPSYIRVLGFNNRGSAILKTMKKTALLPVIGRAAAFKENCPIWELEKRATDIYFMPQRLTHQDVKRPPVYIAN